MALGFVDSDALLVAIKTGLAPKEVAAGSARVGLAAKASSSSSSPTRPCPRRAPKLRAAGVPTPRCRASSRAVRCWAEALLPVAIGVEKVPALALFVTERVADLLDVAAELVRLGCDRIEISRSRATTACCASSIRRPTRSCARSIAITACACSRRIRPARKRPGPSSAITTRSPSSCVRAWRAAARVARWLAHDSRTKAGCRSTRHSSSRARARRQDRRRRDARAPQGRAPAVEWAAATSRACG